MKETLVLKSHCPSKKNLWKRGRGGRTCIDDETAALIDALTTQAQWKRELKQRARITAATVKHGERREYQAPINGLGAHGLYSDRMATMARWFEEAWFWIKAVSVGEGAVVVYARATTPFEVVTVSIASLIFARLALLEVGYELMGEILTT